ncbi:hypothetical protein QL285_071072 [Trifolium repens]|nr:hypothetical protein QL285_071072 [Trifolium repens]
MTEKFNSSAPNDQSTVHAHCKFAISCWLHTSIYRKEHLVGMEEPVSLILQFPPPITRIFRQGSSKVSNSLYEWLQYQPLMFSLWRSQLQKIHFAR